VESVAYYESKEAGLGWRFRTEVIEAVGWIERNPELAGLRPKGYRRRNLQAFPHIAYVIRDDAIWIVAIAHGTGVRNFGAGELKAEERPAPRLRVYCSASR
jgi:hypothetical protein